MAGEKCAVYISMYITWLKVSRKPRNISRTIFSAESEEKLKVKEPKLYKRIPLYDINRKVGNLDDDGYEIKTRISLILFK